MTSKYFRLPDFRHWSRHEAFWQALALVLAFTVVHTTYELGVRPAAAAELARAAALPDDGPAETAEVPETAETAEAAETADGPWGGRVAVVIKDYEQEACIVALLWALAIMGMKLQKLRHARRLFALPGRGGEASFLETGEADLILPEARDRARFTDLREHARARGYGGTVLYRAADACLDRFFTTCSVADATAAMKAGCELEAERQDTELALVRYLTWAIPSIGFIGTVRGIGAALARAEEATRGNIGPVTESLGTAFNSTFVALLLSLVVMLLLHKLQEAQEALVLDAQEHCQTHLLRYLRERVGTDHGGPA